MMLEERLKERNSTAAVAYWAELQVKNSNVDLSIATVDGRWDAPFDADEFHKQLEEELNCMYLKIKNVRLDGSSDDIDLENSDNELGEEYSEEKMDLEDSDNGD